MHSRDQVQLAKELHLHKCVWHHSSPISHTHAVAVMSGSARMQFLPTLSLGVTWARELWRADSRAAVSGGWEWGGGGGGGRG